MATKLMDVVSPPTSARSCSSMASDLIEDDRDKLTAVERLSFNKRHATTTPRTEHGEEYDMDMVLENFFGIHHEIDDISSSLTSGSPNISPRLDEYPTASMLQAVRTGSTAHLSPHQHATSASTHGHNEMQDDSSFNNSQLGEHAPMTMALVSGADGEGAHLIPGDDESRRYLFQLRDSQEKILQNQHLRRRQKTITFKVSISIFEEEPEPDPEPEFETVTAPRDGSAGTFASLLGNPAHSTKTSVTRFQTEESETFSSSHSSTAVGKYKDKGKYDKTKKNNLMRHIYKTNCNAYRVQISFGSKVHPNGKFSRNTRIEIDALWLCELAILFVHQPTSSDYLFHWGNFDYLMENGHCSSYEDYINNLMRQFVDLTCRSLIKPHEFEILQGILSNFFPTLQEEIAALDMKEIIAIGKINKKKAASAKKSSLSALLETDELLSPSKVYGPWKGKVVIPVLQLPTSSSSMSSSLPVSGPCGDSRAEVTAGNKVANEGQEAFGRQRLELEHYAAISHGLGHTGCVVHDGRVDQSNNDGDVNASSGAGSSADGDSKRRRVPAHNPTHQSPRTLEMFQQARRR